MLALLILFALAYRVSAQHSYRNFSIGAGAGLARPYTDREHADLGYMASGTLDYHFTPFLNAGLELQGGLLSAYSNSPESGRKEGFESRFATLQVRGKVHFGEFTRRPGRYRLVHHSLLNRVVKGFYLGGGGGLLVVKSREGSEAVYHNKELYLPAIAGFDIPLREDSRLFLNLNYQLNFVLGDKIDGLVPRGGRNDMFSSLTMGLSYTFGRLSYL